MQGCATVYLHSCVAPSVWSPVRKLEVGSSRRLVSVPAFHSLALLPLVPPPPVGLESSSAAKPRCQLSLLLFIFRSGLPGRACGFPLLRTTHICCSIRFPLPAHLDPQSLLCWPMAELFSVVPGCPWSSFCNYSGNKLNFKNWTVSLA